MSPMWPFLCATWVLFMCVIWMFVEWRFAVERGSAAEKRRSVLLIELQRARHFRKMYKDAYIDIRDRYFSDYDEILRMYRLSHSSDHGFDAFVDWLEGMGPCAEDFPEEIADV